MMNLDNMGDGLDLTILAPAFLAGVIVLLTHIPLGREVLKRGIIFIDLAIAQIAGLGVIVAFQFGWDMHGAEAQFAAVLSACYIEISVYTNWFVSDMTDTKCSG